MNFKNSEFLMLVAAFLLGYFFQEMMKGCQVVEGLPSDPNSCSVESNKCHNSCPTTTESFEERRKIDECHQICRDVRARCHDPNDV